MSFFRYRLLYFVVFCVYGAFGPYLGPYLHQLGLADWQIGWISSAGGLAVLLMPLLIGHIADKHISARRMAQSVVSDPFRNQLKSAGAAANDYRL